MSPKSKAKAKANGKALFNLTDDVEVDDLPSVLSQWIPRPPDSNRMNKLCSVSPRKQVVRLPKVEDALADTASFVKPPPTDLRKLSPKIHILAEPRKNPATTGKKNFGEAKIVDTLRRSRTKVVDPERIEFLSTPREYSEGLWIKPKPAWVPKNLEHMERSGQSWLKCPLEYPFKAEVHQDSLELLHDKAVTAGLSESSEGLLRRQALRELETAPFTVPGLLEGLTDSDEITNELARKQLKEVMAKLWDRYLNMMRRGGIGKLDEACHTLDEARKRIAKREERWASESRSMEMMAQKKREKEEEKLAAESKRTDDTASSPRPDSKTEFTKRETTKSEDGISAEPPQTDGTREPAKSDSVSSLDLTPKAKEEPPSRRTTKDATPMQPPEPSEPQATYPELPEDPSDELKKAHEVLKKDLTDLRKAASHAEQACAKTLELARSDLILACRAGLLPIVLPFITDGRVVPPGESVGPEVSRAVANAARFGHGGVIRQLLDLGERIDPLQQVEDPGRAWTSWEEAALFGHKHAVLTLGQKKSKAPAVGPGGPPEFLAALIPDLLSAPAPLSESICKILLAYREYSDADLTASLRSVCSVPGSNSNKQARSVAALKLMLREKWGQVSLSCIKDSIAAKNFGITQVLVKECIQSMLGQELGKASDLRLEITEAFQKDFPEGEKELQQLLSYYCEELTAPTAVEGESETDAKPRDTVEADASAD